MGFPTLLLAVFGSLPATTKPDAALGGLSFFEVYLPAAMIGARRPTSHTTINASGNSTVFNGQVMNFGAFHFHGGRSAPGEEIGTS